MTPHFNLLDESWLPVRLADGRVVELGLLDIFARSGEITALADTAPPNLVAQYRLLLAITHRSLVRARETWKDKDRADWYRNGLPLGDVRAYLEYWRERFWLFHPQHPFMQVAALATCDETNKLYPPSTVSMELFFGTEIFNQEIYRDSAWPPDRVVGSLLGYLQFAPGGFFPGKKLKTSEKAGALANTAAVIPVGRTLAETLCLCLQPPPTVHSDEDLPAWERAPLTIAQLSGNGNTVLATGPNDRYTRQSRAVLLQRDDDGKVRWLRFAAGYALGDDENSPDPMASFKVSRDKLVRMTFNEGRALWRDLPTLVPNAAGQGQVAAVVNWAINLRGHISFFDTVFQPLLVSGLASDQAKLLRWRMEQIALPAGLLVDPDKALELRNRVAQAEEIFGQLRSLATHTLTDIFPDPRSKDTRGRAGDVLRASSFAAGFFASAERALPTLMQEIADGQTEAAEAHWRAALRVAAGNAWAELQKCLGASPRALRAEAMHWPRFNGLLNKELPKDETLVQEV